MRSRGTRPLQWAAASSTAQTGSLDGLVLRTCLKLGHLGRETLSRSGSLCARCAAEETHPTSSRWVLLVGPLRLWSVADKWHWWEMQISNFKLVTHHWIYSLYLERAVHLTLWSRRSHWCNFPCHIVLLRNKLCFSLQYLGLKTCRKLQVMKLRSAM